MLKYFKDALSHERKIQQRAKIIFNFYIGLG